MTRFAFGIICLAFVLSACSGRVREIPSASDTPVSASNVEPIPTTSGCPSRYVSRITTIAESGGRVDWSPATDLIAFDRLGEDGYYDLYTMQPDGSNEVCLTCGKDGLIPQKNIGNPAWHPSGKYIAVQVENESHPGPSASSTPGFGLYNDLWLVSSDGRSFMRLTDTSGAQDSGVLHPHFSSDGKQLAWSELIEKPSLTTRGKEFGYWKLKVADFAIDETGPVLSNIREYEPGGPAFYENHGFSSDGSSILFSSNFGREGSALRNNDIYSMNLSTGAVTQLTAANYNEHANYSPDGSKIVWMSNEDNSGTGTDYWLMNADGSGKERLTYFNQAGCPESSADRVTVADNSWGPAGDKIVAYIQTDLLRQRGRIVLIELNTRF